MAAGQGFKTFVTGEVLTSGDVNGYLMQGINVFTNATARDAAITAPAEGQFAFTKDNNSLWYYDGAAWVASGAAGDIEGVTAGVGISGGGTSGTVTVTNSMATAIDAKGDLVPGTGADTFSRLAVGANGTVLTADSAEATGLKWATASSGGMTLISTTTFSNTSSLSLTSIPQTYKHLYLTFQNMRMATNNEGLYIANVGANVSATWVGRRYDGATLSSTQWNSGDFGYISGSNLFGVIHGPNTTVTRELGFGDVLFPNYTNAQAKFGFSKCAWVDGSSGNWRSSEIWANTGTTAAITNIDFAFGANVTSGTLLLYGVS